MSRLGLVTVVGCAFLFLASVPDAWAQSSWHRDGKGFTCQLVEGNDVGVL